MSSTYSTHVNLKSNDFVCVWDYLRSLFFYYSIYFWYYSWVSLHFLVLFMTSLYYFSYFLTLSTVLSAKKIQFQLNKLFPDRHLNLEILKSNKLKLIVSKIIN